MNNNLKSINGDDDPFNRYKMPQVLIQVLPNNTTQILNLDKIALSLSRTEAEIISRLKKILNVGGNKNSLSGSLTKQQVEEGLTKYINIYILCEKCKNPETEMLICEKKKIRLVCKACGSITKINNV